MAWVCSTREMPQGEWQRSAHGAGLKLQLFWQQSTKTLEQGTLECSIAGQPGIDGTSSYATPPALHQPPPHRHYLPARQLCNRPPPAQALDDGIQRVGRPVGQRGSTCSQGCKLQLMGAVLQGHTVCSMQGLHCRPGADADERIQRQHAHNTAAQQCWPPLTGLAATQHAA